MKNHMKKISHRARAFTLAAGIALSPVGVAGMAQAENAVAQSAEQQRDIPKTGGKIVKAMMAEMDVMKDNIKELKRAVGGVDYDSRFQRTRRSKYGNTAERKREVAKLVTKIEASCDYLEKLQRAEYDTPQHRKGGTVHALEHAVGEGYRSNILDKMDGVLLNMLEDKKVYGDKLIRRLYNARKRVEGKKVSAAPAAAPATPRLVA